MLAQHESFMLEAAQPIYFKISQINSALSLRSFIFQVHWAATPFYTSQRNVPRPFQRKDISNRSSNRLIVPYSLSYTSFKAGHKSTLWVLEGGCSCCLAHVDASWQQLLPQGMVWRKLCREEEQRKWLSHHTSHQIPRSPKHRGEIAVITCSYRQPVSVV